VKVLTDISKEGRLAVHAAIDLRQRTAAIPFAVSRRQTIENHIIILVATRVDGKRSAFYNLGMDAIELQRIRAVPLEAVLEGFGAQRDSKDPRRNWRVAHSRITVTGERFFDHNQDVGGGGALDLTLHLMGRDFKRPRRDDLREATRWLGAADRAMQATTPTPATSAAMIAAAEPAQPPESDPSRIGRVRWYLTQRRAIPESIVDREIERGSLFADYMANAVFRLHDDTGREVGYEKRGTHDKAFHSVHGEKGLFLTGSRANGVAAFVESAIEALSYRALGADVLAISTTGNAVELPDRMARHLRERGFRIVAAFNADADGDRFAQRFAERLGGAVERDRPAGAKDWNQILQLKRGPDRARDKGAQTPDMALEATR
jgi:hypothetical protein